LDLLRRCNKYIDETEPWKLAKDTANKQELNKVLYNLLEAIRFAAVLLSPFMPETSRKVLDQLNTEKRDYDSIQQFGQLEDNHKVAADVKPLFARLNAEEVLARIHADLDKPAVKHKDEVAIEDFEKLEIKVGKIISCEKHPSADKLLVFKLDFGNEERQIVSGIAKWYKPEELVGKKVAAIVNLKPVKLRGVESQGMILSAEDENGDLEVVSLDKVGAGAEIR
ncbi:MAG: methionine--tRNA ligase subunit beta, partial [Erysipelotrichaceae bacterium]|nr:methionine--tRNA ligase subunit beta [Erysipelotrichaceae bacterium]